MSSMRSSSPIASKAPLAEFWFEGEKAKTIRVDKYHGCPHCETDRVKHLELLATMRQHGFVFDRTWEFIRCNQCNRTHVIQNDECEREE